MCPQIIPGIEPSGTNTEQIRDASASAEKRSEVWGGRLAAAEYDNTDRGAGREAGGGDGEVGGAPRVAASVTAGFITGAGVAMGMVIVFWQAGQATLVPL